MHQIIKYLYLPVLLYKQYIISLWKINLFPTEPHPLVQPIATDDFAAMMSCYSWPDYDEGWIMPPMDSDVSGVTKQPIEGHLMTLTRHTHWSPHTNNHSIKLNFPTFVSPYQAHNSTFDIKIIFMTHISFITYKIINYLEKKITDKQSGIQYRNQRVNIARRILSTKSTLLYCNIPLVAEMDHFRFPIQASNNSTFIPIKEAICLTHRTLDLDGWHENDDILKAFYNWKLLNFQSISSECCCTGCYW